MHTSPIVAAYADLFNDEELDLKIPESETNN